MFIDGRTLDGQTLDADICLIGGGVAGIAIAREFIGKGSSIIMLESGGMEGDPDTQALYAGEVNGRPYELLESRLRFFGGSSNHWEGMCAPLDDSDFEKRDWIPFSGWPINKETLNPYYKKAAAFLNLSGKGSDIFPTRDDLLPKNNLFAHGSWRQAQALKPAETYHDELAKAQNIRVVLSSNVTKIKSNENKNHAESVDVATLSGQAFSVRAKRYVLCCGGIENARLLLLSDGLENNMDMVGRFFMEHPRMKIGTLYTYNDVKAVKPFEQYIGMADAPDVVYNITPSPETLRKLKILTSAVVVRDMEEMTKPPSVPAYMAKMMGVTAKKFYKMTLFGRVEQAPNPDNYVRLGEEKDALGLPRVKITVGMGGEMEWRSLREISMLLANFLPAHNIGLVHLDEWLRKSWRWPNYAFWSYHHMGTTRMSERPQDGVVDKNCKLHSVDNVFVAGSSVFATSGWANPTHTLTALAIRLADHLKEEVR